MHFVEDGVGEVSGGEPRGIDDELAGIFVERATVAQHILHGLAGVLRLQQRAVCVARDAFEDHIFLRPQPDDKPQFRQDRQVAGLGDNAAAGGNHVAAFPGQAAQGLGFVFAEALFAFLLKNPRDRAARFLADEIIRIDKMSAADSCQMSPHTALACAHKTDEDNVDPGGSGLGLDKSCAIGIALWLLQVIHR